MKEVWNFIKGFEGFYEVSSLGRIRSVKRTVVYKDGREYKYKSKIIKSRKDPRGYPQVVLNKSGVKSTRRVHRLVAETFMPNRSEGEEVNHIDGIKSNNKSENLEWVTSSENTRKGYELGLFDKTKKLAGERLRNNNYQSKKVCVYYKKTDEWTNFKSAREASLNFGRCKNYFTELLRKGGENKYFKVKFHEDKKELEA